MKDSKERWEHEEVVDVSKEVEKVGEEMERRNLKEYLHTVIHIRSIEERSSDEYGTYYVIKLVDNNEAYTFSKKVGEQFHLLEMLLSAGKIIRTKVALNKCNQVYFMKP